MKRIKFKLLNKLVLNFMTIIGLLLTILRAIVRLIKILSIIGKWVFAALTIAQICLAGNSIPFNQQVISVVVLAGIALVSSSVIPIANFLERCIEDFYFWMVNKLSDYLDKKELEVYEIENEEI